MHPCDGQTGGQTDGRWHILTRYNMLSRAKNDAIVDYEIFTYR